MNRLNSFCVLCLILCLSLPLLGGCGKLPWCKSMEVPEVSLANIELEGIQGLETICVVTLRIINPNSYPLDLRGIQCKLLINRTSFADGLSDEHIRIPASGTVTVPVTVYTTMFHLVGPLIDLLQKSPAASTQAVQYELAGKLLLGSKGEEAIPFVLQGRFPPEVR